MSSGPSPPPRDRLFRRRTARGRGEPRRPPPMIAKGKRQMPSGLPAPAHKRDCPRRKRHADDKPESCHRAWPRARPRHCQRRVRHRRPGRFGTCIFGLRFAHALVWGEDLTASIGASYGRRTDLPGADDPLLPPLSSRLIRELAGVLPRRRHFPLLDGVMRLFPAASPTGRQAQGDRWRFECGTARLLQRKRQAAASRAHYVLPSLRPLVLQRNPVSRRHRTRTRKARS